MVVEPRITQTQRSPTGLRTNWRVLPGWKQPDEKIKRQKEDEARNQRQTGSIRVVPVKLVYLGPWEEEPALAGLRPTDW
jgi:hypothetical protein